mmetsp:Transcript_19176/g.55052  ORF Transcript_19176/g.55052 Transcript_19176/m.55052 type:complete len:201 (-) Transcript_19176:55-657(-)
MLHICAERSAPRRRLLTGRVASGRCCRSHARAPRPVTKDREQAAAIARMHATRVRLANSLACMRVTSSCKWSDVPAGCCAASAAVPARAQGDVARRTSWVCSSKQRCSWGKVAARFCENALMSTASRDAPTNDAGAEKILPGTARDGGLGTGMRVLKACGRECGDLIQWPFDLPSTPALFTRAFQDMWSAWMSFKAVSAP